MTYFDHMWNKNLKSYFSAVLLSIAIGGSAVTLDEAKEMYRAGDFTGALPVFLDAYKTKPRDASLNQWIGVCLIQEGRPDEAVKYLRFAHDKGVAEAPRYLAELAFYDYDFDKAEEYIERYEKSLKKSRKPLPEDMEALQARIDIARNMLDRVEKIVIIDSVAVDRDEFFKAYRLSPESGSVNDADVLPQGYEAASMTAVYMPETRSFMAWAAPDSMENYVLVGANQLFDGSWEAPSVLGESLAMNGDSNYPFMMSDGVTLYYANDGDESLGGYDIFISRKDEDDFLQPQNIGMPYNSPYDDYLLAIDEVTGVGWWATDRNQLGDYITIYKFIPSDLRNNYPVDTPDLAAKARVTSYRSTWAEGDDYSGLLAEIEAIDPDRKVKKEDFRFALPGGRVYTTWDDFKKPRARHQMEEYVRSKDALDKDLDELAALRVRYHDGDRSVKDAVLRLEKRVIAAREELKAKANEVVKAER